MRVCIDFSCAPVNMTGAHFPRPALNKNLILFNRVWSNFAAGARGSWPFVKWPRDAAYTSRQLPAAGRVWLFFRTPGGKAVSALRPGRRTPRRIKKRRTARRAVLRISVHSAHSCVFRIFLRILRILHVPAHSARSGVFCLFLRILRGRLISAP